MRNVFGFDGSGLVSKRMSPVDIREMVNPNGEVRWRVKLRSWVMGRGRCKEGEEGRETEDVAHVRDFVGN